MVLEYDLPVLDIMMPGLTGLEFTALHMKIRAILLLTAFAAEQRIEGCRFAMITCSTL